MKPRLVLRCVVRGGEVVGYRAYRRSALGLSFSRYYWLA